MTVHGANGRELGWDGFYNTRDLGGLATGDGRVTRSGVFVRSADPRFVTTAGWQAAYRAGVRTVVDLRNEDEIRVVAGGGATAAAGSGQFVADRGGPVVPAGMLRVEVPLDDIEDVAFWRELNGAGLNGTPLYFRPFLERKAERCAEAVRALARAVPGGGVLFHCGAGRDRTGLVALLLLSLAGVEADAIADDYTAGAASLRALCAKLGKPDPEAEVAAALASRGTTARAALLGVLDGFDAEDYLLAAGVPARELALLRRALVG